jgi:hypothetical protein
VAARTRDRVNGEFACDTAADACRGWDSVPRSTHRTPNRSGWDRKWRGSNRFRTMPLLSRARCNELATIKETATLTRSPNRPNGARALFAHDVAT